MSKTKIVCILDRSGSMESMKDEAISGFNAFLKEQQAVDGEADITVCLFDNELLYPYDGIDLREAEPMTKETFVPRGTTALYEAIGQTVCKVAATVEEGCKCGKCCQPDKVILAILTDGANNITREWNITKVKELLKKKQKEGWDVFYLAANQDAFAVGESMGIMRANAMSYNANVLGGTSQGYGSMSRRIKSSRVS
jgi:hypothetical protein